MHRAAAAATGIAPLSFARAISSAQWRHVAGRGHPSGDGDLRRANESWRPETDYYQESRHVPHYISKPALSASPTLGLSRRSRAAARCARARGNDRLSGVDDVVCKSGSSDCLRITLREDRVHF